MSNKYSKDSLLLKKISYYTDKLVDSLVFFDFYDPTQQLDIIKYLADKRVYYQFYGGHPQTERKMLCIYSTPLEDIHWPISVCKANVDFAVNHRSVLGALMNLGINREIIGDIVIGQNEVNIISKSHMAEYISMNLCKIGNRNIDFKTRDIDSLEIQEPQTKEMSISVKSLRADSIISAVYGLSRDESSSMIKRGKVKVNHREIYKVAENIEIGDLLSVRGKGRFVVSENYGYTKKGRSKLKVNKYV